ncbi:phage tail protein [Paenibacillus radicis (ex Xue et al. 2023)]|uniref:Tail fiber protein n=1 Tax=Paenibacillus radicis (ex Xue et al. 2023) TaxID=2972489 RepID=A0ABT1YDE4_9BACL|nr:tail fiber protein [Paenibacillus radicis (ex Xue et al. 2023)]MCR8631207.1 tail fiber protein [Paenibacillus radicis (ex Xue et al. 2023)]
MAEPFVGEIRMFTGNFAPRGWAFCNGQLLPISQNTALFSLLGTNYGGDGKSTFALPNLQGRAPMHQGQGPGLSIHDLGEAGGQEVAPLIASELPAHKHELQYGVSTGSKESPSGALWTDVKGRRPVHAYASGTTSLTPMSAQAIQTTGNNAPHNNMQPYLTVTFIIALQGVFPPRS